MGRRVLLIDGDADDATRMIHALRAASYQAAVAGSVLEGVVLARRIRPALVITSVDLPDGDGLYVVKRLKVVGIPVMVIGAENAAVRASALTLGAVECLTRPVEVQLLLARVAVHVRTHHEKKW